jgi:hypothetical protein
MATKKIPSATASQRLSAIRFAHFLDPFHPLHPGPKIATACKQQGLLASYGSARSEANKFTEEKSRTELHLNSAASWAKSIAMRRAN